MFRAGRSLVRTARGEALPQDIDGKYGYGDYEITGLGTAAVRAKGCQTWLAVRLPWTDISDDIKARSAGQKRPYRPDEMLSDPITGIKWNWIGSSRSGGPDAAIWPGGVGNVDIPARNAWDAAAKKHDIQFWLATNFQMGSRVRLKESGRWTTYVVKSLAAVNTEVMADFFEASNRLLKEAEARATSEKERRLIQAWKDNPLNFKKQFTIYEELCRIRGQTP
jgi:hypothetical protein